MNDIEGAIAEAGRMALTVLPPGTGYALFAWDNAPGTPGCVFTTNVEEADLEDLADNLERFIQAIRTQDGTVRIQS